MLHYNGINLESHSYLELDPLESVRSVLMEVIQIFDLGHIKFTKQTVGKVMKVSQAAKHFSFLENY